VHLSAKFVVPLHLVLDLVDALRSSWRRIEFESFGFNGRGPTLVFRLFLALRFVAMRVSILGRLFLFLSKLF
jgi:hypothetical protein